jgi:hypothetical protein
MSRADFKEAVDAYVELNDEILRAGKQARELRKQKDLIGVKILEWMQTNQIDGVDLETGRLARRISKRTEPMKKEHILSELTKVLGDPARAEASLQNIVSMRAIVQKETLSRTTKRPDVGEDVDEDDQ